MNPIMKKTSITDSETGRAVSRTKRTPSRFPADFVWGAASASYQIEGGWNEDGKGLSVWDVFSHQPGIIYNNDNGDVACDHYHRHKEDVGLMKQIGLDAYRLSLSWPRLMPEGTGKVNSKGLEFYDRLIDELLENGITPYVTLFHWDLPYALEQRGAWLNPSSPDWFAEYTAVAVSKLSDRVKHWMTFNEPQCFIGLGYLDGAHAPGRKVYFSEYLQMAHHVAIAHGKSIVAIRANAQSPVQVGFAMVGHSVFPATETAADIAAARKAMFAISDKTQWNNSWWMDPILLGTYPEEGIKLYGKDMPKIRPDDLKTACQPLDFFGYNTYFGRPVKASADGGFEWVPPQAGHPLTAFKWKVAPESLYWNSRFYHERYKLPLYITENGLSCCDWVSLDGNVHDPQRIDFLHRYLKSVKRACAEGIPVKGYFQWSIMDNFEWREGFKERFGLIYVDFQTQQRILKDSACWYRETISRNGENI
jgi:beta-glucosidase